MTKRWMSLIVALAMIMALLTVLAACGEKGTGRNSKGREDQALECLKNFAGAKTVEELEKYTTEMSQEMKEQCEALLQTGSMAEVAWVNFVETYEGVDVYSVAYLDPNTGEAMSHMGWSGLVWQNGKYLVSTDMALQEKLAARYTDCGCVAGKVFTAVDPCKTCNGTGMAPGISTEQSSGALQLNPELVIPVTPEESLGSVEGNVIQVVPGEVGTVEGNVIQVQPVEGDVSLGSGQIAVIQPDGSVQVEDSTDLERVVVSPGYISGTIGEADLCPDCKGVTEYKGVDCTDCKGLGILINK